MKASYIPPFSTEVNLYPEGEVALRIASDDAGRLEKVDDFLGNRKEGWSSDDWEEKE